MIIKSFTGESASAAMKLVRKEMGGEAIVLKTRQFSDRYNRPQVEITACLEKPSVGRMSDILDDGPRSVERFTPPVVNEPILEAPVEDVNPAIEMPSMPLPVNDDRLAKIEATLDRLVRMTITRGTEQIADPDLRTIVAALRDADVPEDFIDEFLLARQDRFVGPQAIEKVRVELTKELARLTTTELKISAGDRVLFIGPAGAGKSSAMGKLATQLVASEKRKVALSSMDFQKVGAHEELAGYADLLDVDVADFSGDKISKQVTKGAITLIDGPALPADSQRRDTLIKSAAGVGAKYRFLVFSALMRSSDIRELAEQYRWFAPTHLVATMLDLTRRQGSLIAAARAFKVKIAFVSDSTGGLGRLKTADPSALASTLTGTEVQSE